MPLWSAKTFRWLYTEQKNHASSWFRFIDHSNSRILPDPNLQLHKTLWSEATRHQPKEYEGLKILNEKRSSLLVKIEALLQPALTQHHISTPESIQAALPSTVHKYAPMLSNPRLCTNNRCIIITEAYFLTYLIGTRIVELTPLPSPCMSLFHFNPWK
jgi:hypothetical protein